MAVRLRLVFGFPSQFKFLPHGLPKRLDLSLALPAQIPMVWLILLVSWGAANFRDT